MRLHWCDVVRHTHMSVPLMVDRLGAYYVPSHATQWMSDSIKMLSLIPTSDVTGLWTFCVEDMLYVIPKY